MRNYLENERGSCTEFFEFKINTVGNIGVRTDVLETVDFAISGVLDGEVDVDIFSEGECELKEHGDFFVGKVILTLLHSGIPEETILSVVLQIIDIHIFWRRNVEFIPIKQSDGIPATSTEGLRSDRSGQFQVELER
jgi:hypothetical protein